MSAEQLLSHVSQGAFVVIWIAVLIQALRRPRAATIHAAAFFGLATVIVVNGWVTSLRGADPPEFVRIGMGALLSCMPFVLLLLAHDFAGVRRGVLAGSGLLLAGVVLSLYAVSRPYPLPYTLGVVTYLIVVSAYATGRFVQAGSGSSGVSRRRVQAVAIATALLGVIFVLVGLSAAIPEQRSAWSSMSSVASFLCGSAYLAAFMPPRFLRQAWQAPQLQRFFGDSTLAPRGSLAELVRTLEGQVASMLGGSQEASIALWDEQRQALVWPGFEGERPTTIDMESTIAYRSFRSQQATFVEHAERIDPANAAAYREYGAQAITAAPITIGERRLGLLMAFGRRAPLFAEDELEVVQIIARQVAILLRDYQLTEELTAVRGHQEAARLKDDFLAAAAHDLRTPLTSLVAQSQLMQRRALRDPNRPTDMEGIKRIVQETNRMRRVVDDLLDAARGDQVGFVGEVRQVDLVALVSDVVSGIQGRVINFRATPITIEIDPERIRQVVTNLCDNAVKYSPQGGDIDVTLEVDAGFAVMVIKDRGIGISAEDAKIIFERFRRAPGVRYGSMTGLGLGLYFCKRIVEEHGGQITLRSTLGEGSEFEVRLPMAPPTLARRNAPAVEPAATSAGLST